MRAMTSDGPPAEKGTMIVMGREGKFCAAADPPKARAAIAVRINLNITISLKLLKLLRGAMRRSNPLNPEINRSLRVYRNDGPLELRIVDRLVTIERARHRRQRVFESRCTIEQHH